MSAPVAAAIVKGIQKAFDSPRKDLLIDDLAEQNTTPANAAEADINQRLEAPRVPPRLMEVLPPLPKQLEYDFAGRTLVIRDVDADLVVDVVPDALPAPMPAAEVKEAPPDRSRRERCRLWRCRRCAAARCSCNGRHGFGRRAQQAVAQAMVTYFTTARRFPFVIMLGDNLYDDDYTNEFLIPYKPLLDRGVKFYATLGNHDRDLEIHFKPFNMNDVDRYAFDEGNARFATLNSNHPADPEQITWLNGAYTNAGDKWRIAFFHHPLYSSGQHAEGAAT